MTGPHPERIKEHSFLMLPIKGGSFPMGSPRGDGDAFEDERPSHAVTIAAFYLAQYPVTQALWQAVMGENPAYFQGDDRPVEQVSWDDVRGFIEMINTLTAATRPNGYAYRLPTEAQWEYAGRGGRYHQEGYHYAGSDRLKDVAWFGENSGDETKPVGLKRSNQLGLHDMSGNVWERCADDWHNTYQDAPTDGSAWIDQPVRGSHRVLRGGGWLNVPRSCPFACRWSGCYKGYGALPLRL